MIFLLGFLLILLTVFTYYIYGRDLLTPSIWLIFGYDVSVLLSLTQFSLWGDIEPKTVFTILLGVIAFVLGGALGSKIKNNDSSVIYHLNSIKISSRFAWICTTFMAVVTIYNYRYTYRIAYAAGFSGGFNFLSYARYALGDDFMGYPLYISISIAQVLCYVLLYDLIHSKLNKSNNIRILVPEIIAQLLYLIIGLLSTGRTMLLHYIIYGLSVLCFLIKAKNEWNISNNSKILKYGLASIIIILTSFWIIDSRLRASIYGTERTMWGQITKYVSSSIYALNEYLKDPTYASDTGGYETLYNVVSILKRIGFNIPKGPIALKPINYANVSTNIYTALRRYIHDYGYLGMMLIQFGVGAVYQHSYTKIKQRKCSLFEFYIYCTFIYAVVFNSIEERFLINVLSLRTLITIFTLLMIYKICGVTHDTTETTNRNNKYN